LTDDEHYIALPKLYGAPAYARPPRPVPEALPRPLDPDDLPLEAFRGPDDLDLAEASSSDAGGHGAGSGDHAVPGDREPGLEPRAFNIRSLSRLITGR